MQTSSEMPHYYRHQCEAAKQITETLQSLLVMPTDLDNIDLASKIITRKLSQIRTAQEEADKARAAIDSAWQNMQAAGIVPATVLAASVLDGAA